MKCCKNRIIIIDVSVCYFYLLISYECTYTCCKNVLCFVLGGYSVDLTEKAVGLTFSCLFCELHVYMHCEMDINSFWSLLLCWEACTEMVHANVNTNTMILGWDMIRSRWSLIWGHQVQTSVGRLWCCTGGLCQMLSIWKRKLGSEVSAFVIIRWVTFQNTR